MNEWKRISSLANVRRGASPRPIGDPSYFGGSVGWVRISDVTRSSRFLRETEQYVSPLGESLSVRVNPGDLVMSICGTLGRPIVIDIPACIHDGFVQFTNLKDVDSVYLFYALQFSESKFNGMGQPGTQTNLNTTLVGRLEIFAPPIEIQRRIATILSTLDEVIEATERLVEKHRQIQAGLMHDLFTRGLWTRAELARGDHHGLPCEATVQEGQLRPPPEEVPGLYQESPLGLIPKEWEAASLLSVSNSMTNGFVGTATPYYSEDEDAVQYLYGNNVRADKLELPTSLRVTRKFHELQRKSQLQPGDMLTVQSGHIGTSATVPDSLGEANCHALIITKLKSNRAVPNFVSYYCNSPNGYSRLGSIFVGSTILHINVKEFKNFTIPLPKDLSEQNEICNRLIAINERIDTEVAHLAKLRQQKQGLMHDLLTGRVRVSAELQTAG